MGFTRLQQACSVLPCMALLNRLHLLHMLLPDGASRTQCAQQHGQPVPLRCCSHLRSEPVVAAVAWVPCALLEGGERLIPMDMMSTLMHLLQSRSARRTHTLQA